MRRGEGDVDAVRNSATGTIGIASVSTPADRLDLRPEDAERILADLVFLPAYPELADRELARLGAAVEAGITAGR